MKGPIASILNSDLSFLLLDSAHQWWPVLFKDNTGRTIEAELKMGERDVTNDKQNAVLSISAILGRKHKFTKSL